MFGFGRREGATLEGPAAELRVATSPPPATGLEIGVERVAVEEATRIIQEHVDREARNRRVRYLAVKDLCPSQKAELVADLARVFR